MKLCYVIFTFLLISCHANSNHEMAETVKLDEVSSTNRSDALDQSIRAYDSMLIKEGRMSFESDSVSQSRTLIVNAISKYRGYIYQENQGFNNGQRNHEIVIKIPSENFDSLIAEIENDVENISYKSINVRDVSEEFLDMNARIRNKKVLEERYLNLLSKSGKLEDMIYLEDQLATLRGTIEAIEGRLQKMKNSVSYSTLTINYFENDEGDGAQPIAEAFMTGWSRFSVMIIGLFSIWPFVLIVLIAISYMIYRRKSLR